MNKQSIPQSIYPITGDVQSTTGDPTVTVVGMQKTPISSQHPTDGQIYIYDSKRNLLIPGDPLVSGPNPVGAPPASNPVQVGGIDEGNLIRELRLDSYGSLRALGAEELQLLILLELRAIKAATIQSNQLSDTDYEAENFI